MGSVLKTLDITASNHILPTECHVLSVIFAGCIPKAGEGEKLSVDLSLFLLLQILWNLRVRS